jgi:hypothetical protein
MIHSSTKETSLYPLCITMSKFSTTISTAAALASIFGVVLGAVKLVDERKTVSQEQPQVVPHYQPEVKEETTEQTKEETTEQEPPLKVITPPPAVKLPEPPPVITPPSVPEAPAPPENKNNDTN